MWLRRETSQYPKEGGGSADQARTIASDKDIERNVCDLGGGIKHAFGDEGGELGDFFVDVIPSPALDGIMTLTPPAALLVRQGSLLVRDIGQGRGRG